MSTVLVVVILFAIGFFLYTRSGTETSSSSSRQPSLPPSQSTSSFRSTSAKLQEEGRPTTLINGERHRLPKKPLEPMPSRPGRKPDIVARLSDVQRKRRKRVRV